MLALGAKTNHADILWLFTYQAISLLISLVIIATLSVLKGSRFETLRIGQLRAGAREIKFLGVRAGESWIRVGSTFAVAISLATATYIFFSYQEKFASTTPINWLLGFALSIPLSILNSFNEEIITRWSIVESFLGSKAERFAPWFSAIVFGTIHYFGIPGGLPGSAMAGFLAWLLARSIQDIRGIGWAWLVHFLQDIIILTAVIAISL